MKAREILHLDTINELRTQLATSQRELAEARAERDALLQEENCHDEELHGWERDFEQERKLREAAEARAIASERWAKNATDNDDCRKMWQERAEVAEADLVERTKERDALLTNCRAFNEAGLLAIRDRDQALKDVAFWENLSNANSDSADSWKARATASERQVEAMREVLGKALPALNATERLATIERAGYPRKDETEGLHRIVDEFLDERRAALGGQNGD